MAFCCTASSHHRFGMACNSQQQNLISPLSFRYKTHSRTVNAVDKEFKKLTSQLREDDTLPASLEGALHLISLSARLFLGNDGGLARLLKPLSAEKLALEREFSDRKIGRCALIEGHVKEAIQMINSTTNKAKVECKIDSIRMQEAKEIYNPSKRGKRVERVDAEIDAVFNVSAALQNVVWELYDSSAGHRLDEAVKRLSGEAALIIYVIIGCLLRETAMHHSCFLGQTKVGYLQTGLDKLQHSSSLASNLLGGNKIRPGCYDNLNADELVLCIAKQLKAKPESVISEVERRLGKRWH